MLALEKAFLFVKGQLLVTQNSNVFFIHCQDEKQPGIDKSPNLRYHQLF